VLNNCNIFFTIKDFTPSSDIINLTVSSLFKLAFISSIWSLAASCLDTFSLIILSKLVKFDSISFKSTSSSCCHWLSCLRRLRSESFSWFWSSISCILDLKLSIFSFNKSLADLYFFSSVLRVSLSARKLSICTCIFFFSSLIWFLSLSSMHLKQVGQRSASVPTFLIFFSNSEMSVILVVISALISLIFLSAFSILESFSSIFFSISALLLVENVSMRVCITLISFSLLSLRVLYFSCFLSRSSRKWGSTTNQCLSDGRLGSTDKVPGGNPVCSCRSYGIRCGHRNKNGL
jgi:hypothetical protein